MIKGVIEQMGTNKYYGLTRKLLYWVGCLLIIAGVLFPSAVVYGEGRVKPEWVMPRHYPHGFHGMGRIDSITEDQIVIDEHQIRLSPSVVYNTPMEKNVPRELFTPGQKIGYILDSTNRIKSIWLIERD